MFWTDSNEGRILHWRLWYFLVCKHAFHYFEQSIDISQSLVQNLIRLILHQSLSLFSYSNLQNKNVSLETTNFDYIEINIIKIWQIYRDYLAFVWILSLVLQSRQGISMSYLLQRPLKRNIDSINNHIHWIKN